MKADAVASLHLSNVCNSRAQQQLLPGEKVSTAAEGGNFGQGGRFQLRERRTRSFIILCGLLLRNQDGFELCIFPEE